MEIKGRDLVEGVPKTLVVSGEEWRRARGAGGKQGELVDVGLRPRGLVERAGRRRCYGRRGEQGLEDVALVSARVVLGSTLDVDLMLEAANASQLRRNFADSDMLRVPEVYWDWCSSEVMVMERMIGTQIVRVSSGSPSIVCFVGRRLRCG